MKKIRCPRCFSTIAKEELSRVILRTGYGDTRSYHIFDKSNATLTCWKCKEIFNLKEKNDLRTESRIAYAKS